VIMLTKIRYLIITSIQSIFKKTSPPYGGLFVG
jgi:hypothetical protein